MKEDGGESSNEFLLSDR